MNTDWSFLAILEEECLVSGSRGILQEVFRHSKQRLHLMKQGLSLNPVQWSNHPSRSPICHALPTEQSRLGCMDVVNFLLLLLLGMPMSLDNCAGAPPVKWVIRAVVFWTAVLPLAFSWGSPDSSLIHHMLLIPCGRSCDSVTDTRT